MSTALATHEAGHAVASYVLGFTGAGPATIDARGGVVDGLVLVGDAPDVEADIVCFLAGMLAEELLNPFGDHGWTSPEVDRDDVAALTAKLEAMPVQEAASLASALLRNEKPPEQPRTMSGDDEVVWGLATKAWPGDAIPRVSALADRTRALLMTYADAVNTLATELDAHGTLSRDRWHAVLAATGLTPGEAAHGTAAA